MANQRFQSRLSIRSNKSISTNANNLQAEERAKLAMLVKTWRAKFEKAHAASRQHSDHIKTLEVEIDQLKEEKNTVTSDLTTRLQTERNTYEKTIKKLQLEAETARNEPEIEARYLREKLRRLQAETQPIVEFYKKRDKEMETKMRVLEETVEKLQKNEERLREEHQKELEEQSQTVANTQNEVEDEKTKYHEQIEKVKMHCAAKIVEASHRIEAKADEDVKASVAEFEAKYEALQKEALEKIEITKNELETKHQQELSKSVTEQKEKIHQMSIAHAREMLICKKKLGTAETNAYHFKKEWKQFKNALDDSAEQLKKTRILYQSLMFFESDGKWKDHPPIASTANMSDLLQQLSACRRDLREKKRALDRYEDNQSGEILEFMNENQLSLEVAYHTKANEIEYIQKLMRIKKLHPQTPKQSIIEKPKSVVILMQDSVLPYLPVENEQENTAKIKPRPRKKAAQKPKKPDRESNRDKWLYRQCSTVQLNPASNGRQRYYENQTRN